MVSGLLFGCQTDEEIRPNQKLAERAGEQLISGTGDENARKLKGTKIGAFLTPTEEVHTEDDPSSTSGIGTAQFQVIDNGNGIQYEIKVVHISGITAGHIHLAPVGEDDSPEVELNINIPSRLENGVIVREVITEDDFGGQLTGHPLDTLFIVLANGSAYVNIHTNSYPEGEIIGQVSQIMPSENGNYNTQLSGGQEVSSNNSKGRGVVNFKFNADNSALTYKINIANLDNIKASHIHLGKTGSIGPVVVTLGPGMDGPVNGVYAQGVITSDDLSGLLEGGDLEMLREAFRTGNVYVNVHTAVFPIGELRGHL